MQSPQGDGNTHILHNRHSLGDAFEKCSPRKGTETFVAILTVENFEKDLRNAVPARGRKHRSDVWQFTDLNLRNAVPARGRKHLRVHAHEVFFFYNLRNAVPARGRKLVTGRMTENLVSDLRNAVPARGRKLEKG